MAISVHIDLGRQFAVRAPAAEVFGLLSDVPRSAGHFPRLESLTELSPGVYRWQMQRVGTPQVGIRTVYACRYASDPARYTVEWTAVKEVGNAQVSGRWSIADRHGSATQVDLRIAGHISVPVSGLLKAMVAPMVEGEFRSLVDQYIANLTRALGGAA